MQWECRRIWGGLGGKRRVSKDIFDLRLELASTSRHSFSRRQIEEFNIDDMVNRL